MIGLAYTRMELLRTFRNARFLIFSLGFPLILYYAIAGPNGGQQNFSGTGIGLRLYYMVGLASFGTMAAMISTGARIAGERTTGWTRQLRITPLSTRAYFRAKVVTAYAMSLVTIALLYAAGLSLGVGMPARDWLVMTGLILVGLLPFAALGILLGHLLTVDAMGPAVGGLTSLLALVSGTWFPISSGIVHDVAQFLPSFWLVRANRVALGGPAWSTTGWLVVLAWTVILAGLARLAYRRDTARV
jgi:ABC-2 type transport system permease protein